MTPKQRREHIENIKRVLIVKGWEEDRWGNYKKETDDGLFRSKFSKTALRVEKKIGDKWVRKCSNYYKNITVNGDKIEGLKR